MLEQVMQFDNAFLHAVQAISSQPLDLLMAGITLFGNPVFWLLIVAFLYWQGKEHESFHLVNLIAISSIVIGAVKNIVARPRPSANDFRVVSTDNFSLDTYSFPSGHSSLIAANFFYLKNFLKKNLKIIFAIIAVLVAFSRLYLGMHYLTDVIAGLIIGSIIGWAYYRLAGKIAHSRLQLTKSGDAIAIIAILAAAIILVGLMQSIPLSAALIGYYLGFFSLKEIGLHGKELSRQKFITKQAIGFIVLLGITAYAYSGPAFSVLWYGLAGFWISCLWPLIFDKTITHD
ncbi:MAG: phosphatase PAP2 family protein [Candidatus ainarchaeum sp.]|nr:phosphatase PAP2 family protein [Candidatus ainarchaeum sp.]